jgi:hypothetical protein
MPAVEHGGLGWPERGVGADPGEARLLPEAAAGCLDFKLRHYPRLTLLERLVRLLHNAEALVGFRGGRAAGGAEGRAERLRGCPPASRGAAHASLGEPAVADR